MRRIYVALHLFALVLFVFITACGSSNPVTINLPSGVSSTVDAGANSITLTATGSGSTGGVTFTLTPGCGTLTAISATTVAYNPPPPTITATCMVTITATSVSNPSQKKSITLTVNPITVTLASSAPPSTPLGSGAPAVTLTATVNNLATNLTDTITWNLTSTFTVETAKAGKSAKSHSSAAAVASTTCGTLVQSTTNPLQATYTPPASITSNCTAAVEVEVAVADVTVATATDTFTIDEIALTTVPASGTSVSVTEGKTQTLTATLANDGSATPSATWALAPVAPATSCGTLTYNGAALSPTTAVPSGKAVTYTAPSAVCSATATATSVTDPTKTAIVTLNVTAATAITVTFNTPLPGNMDASNHNGSSTQVVAVTVANDSSNSGVTFSPSNSACGSFGSVTAVSSTVYSATFTAALDNTGPMATGTNCSTTFTATSKASSSASATSGSIAVYPILVAIAPPSATYTAGAAPTAFTATVTHDAVGSVGSSNPGTGTSGVSFALNGSSTCGTTAANLSSITATSATYTPPATLSASCTTDLVGTAKAASSGDTGASGFASITVNPTTTTGSITLNPSETTDYTAYGVPSIIYLNPSGGNGGPYTYTTESGNPLPAGFTFDTTLNAIVGTAILNEPTPETFTVRATDSANDVGVSPAITIVTVSPQGNVVSLIGQYTCLFKGEYDDALEPSGGYGWAMVATFTGSFDEVSGVTSFSNPNSSGNNYDYASYEGPTFSNAGHDIQGVLTGTYLLGESDSANHGTATLTMTPSGGSPTTSVWAIVANNVGAPPSTQFNMIEMDDTTGATGSTPTIVAASGRRGSAECYRDTTSAFTASNATTGNFTFGTSGSAPTGEPVVNVGVVQLSGGSISGEADVFDSYNDVDTNYTFTGGSYTAVNSLTGSFVVTSDTSNTEVGDFQSAVYIIDSNRAVTLTTALPSATVAGVFGSGRVERQTPMTNGYTNANALNGDLVLYYHGAEFTGAGTTSFALSDYVSALEQGVGNGSTGLALNVNVEDVEPVGSNCGSTKTCTFTQGSTGTNAFTFSTNGDGRAISSTGGDILYFYGANSAFVMHYDTSPDEVALGEAQPQSSTTAPSGNYILYNLFNSNATGDDSQGLIDLSGGSATILQDASGQEYTQYDQPQTGITYTAGTNPNGFFSVSNAGNPVDCATVSTAETVCITAQTTPDVSILQQ